MVFLRLAAIVALFAMTAAPASAGDFGVRGMGGYSGWADEREISWGPYLGWMGEALYRVDRDMEIGFGVHNPYGDNLTEETNEASGSGETVSRQTDKSAFYPVLASVYIKRAVSSRIRGVLGMGFGYSMGGDRVEESSYRWYSGGNLVSFDESTTTETFAGGLACRLTAGAEYAVGEHLCFFLSAVMGGAMNDIKRTVYRARGTWPDGVAYEYTATTDYNDDGVPRGPYSYSTSGSLVGGNGTITWTTDNAGYRRVDETTYLASVPVKRVTTVTETHRKYHDAWFSFGMLAGVAWYF